MSGGRGGGLEEVIRVVFDDEEVVLFTDLIDGFFAVEGLCAASRVLRGGDCVEEFGKGGLVVRGPVVEGCFEVRGEEAGGVYVDADGLEAEEAGGGDEARVCVSFGEDCVAAVAEDAEGDFEC